MFIGEVDTRWSYDGRNMYLLQGFGYVDKAGRTWFADKGTKIDGASIPKFLWHIVGSPYCGKYRRASVLHDHYYITKHRPKEEVDWMFYQAMLEDGVEERLAKMMYYAVKYFNLKKF